MALAAQSPDERPYAYDTTSGARTVARATRLPRGGATSSWRQHTAAKFQQLPIPKASTQSVFLIPRDPIADLDSEDPVQRGNPNELDACMRPDRRRRVDRRKI